MLCTMRARTTHLSYLCELFLNTSKMAKKENAIKLGKIVFSTYHMGLKNPPLSCGELELTHLSYLCELYVKNGKKGDKVEKYGTR